MLFRVSVTNSILCRFEELACDWSENNEHSRHILGVHRFGSLTVIQFVALGGGGGGGRGCYS